MKDKKENEKVVCSQCGKTLCFQENDVSHRTYYAKSLGLDSISVAMRG